MPDPSARPEGVTVTATGGASGVPDVLRLRLAAQAQAHDIGTALDAASAAMGAMSSRLREGGVAEVDLRSSGASLWSRTDDTGRIVGQVAEQRLAATLRDLSAAGRLVPDVIEAGGQAARLEGLDFAVDDDAALVRAARDDAWRRAGQIAAQHAERAGRALGPVLRVVEGPTGGGPVMRPMALSSRVNEAMPVHGGEQEVSVTIEVEWAFAALPA